MSLIEWANRQFDQYYVISPVRSALFWIIGAMTALNVLLLAIIFPRVQQHLPGSAQLAMGVLMLAALLPWAYFGHPRVRRAAAIQQTPPAVLREVAGTTFGLAGTAGFLLLICLQVIRAALVR